MRQNLFQQFFYFTILVSSPMALSAQTSVGSGVKCPNCSFWGQGSTSAAAVSSLKSHMCRQHKTHCGGTVNSAPPVNVKSAEQIRREREVKDLKEAAEYANDLGVECYNKKDWECAIRYFKESLEYDPDFDDARYNLKKAEEKKRQEEASIPKAPLEPELRVETVTIPSQLQQLINEADRIEVPPPSWESIIESQVELIALNQKKEKHLLLAGNNVLSVLDMGNTWSGKKMLGFKLIIIAGKSTIDAQDAAELVLVRQTALYERILTTLKDKNKSPQLIAAIRALKNKQPLPKGTSPEIAALAKATQNPELGCSSAQITMNAMLSRPAKAAFFQTAVAELGSLVSDKMREIVGTSAQNRFTALKNINNKINLLEDYSKKEADPKLKAYAQFKLEELMKKIDPFKTVPDAISNVLSVYDDMKELKEK